MSANANLKEISESNTAAESPNQRIGFDDMEQIMGGLPDTPADFRKGDKDDDVVEETEEFSDEGDADGSDESGAGNGADGASAKKGTAKDLKKPAVQPEPAKPGEGKAGGEGKAAAAGQALPKEPYRVTVDGKVVDLAPGGTMKVKVDGKDQEVTVHDMVRSYVGKVSYDRKFQDLSKDRQSLETERTKHIAERTQLTNTVKQAHDLAVTKNDPRGMVFLLAEQMKAKPMDVWKGVVTKVAEVLKNNGVAIDDAALENQFKDDEIAYHRDSETRKVTTEAQNNERQALETRMTKVQERFKSEDGETTLTKKAVVNIYDRLVKGGKYSENDITPELIGNIHEADQAFVSAEKVVAELEITDENKEKVLDLVAETKLKNPEFSDAQLSQITREALGMGVQKVSKVLKKKTAESDRKPGTPNKSTSDAALNFDDLDD